MTVTDLTQAKCVFTNGRMRPGGNSVQISMVQQLVTNLVAHSQFLLMVIGWQLERRTAMPMERIPD